MPKNHPRQAGSTTHLVTHQLQSHVPKKTEEQRIMEAQETIIKTNKDEAFFINREQLDEIIKQYNKSKPMLRWSSPFISTLKQIQSNNKEQQKFTVMDIFKEMQQQCSSIKKPEKRRDIEFALEIFTIYLAKTTSFNKNEIVQHNNLSSETFKAILNIFEKANYNLCVEAVLVSGIARERVEETGNQLRYVAEHANRNIHSFHGSQHNTEHKNDHHAEHNIHTLHMADELQESANHLIKWINGHH